MPKATTSREFFSLHPVFRREEYAEALGKMRDDTTVDSMLKQHQRTGNIRRVSRAVYAAVPAHADAETWVVDQFLAASRMRADGVLAYHSALELHGFAYTTFSEVQIVSSGKSGRLDVQGFTCRFLPHPRGWNWKRDVVQVDRVGLPVHTTTLERTVADLFDRHNLGGEAEELFQSLAMIPRLKIDRLFQCVRSLENASAAASLGWWLSTESQRLGVTASDLVKFRGLAPSHPQYVLGAKPGAAKWLSDWSIMVPQNLLASGFEGV